MTRPLIAAFQGHSPQVPDSAFVAPTATVVGDVVLGEEASVWYGAVIRGDVGAIRIGPRSNIQDCCVLHVTSGGMGSVLLDGCVIGEESLVGAGSIVLEGTRVPPRSFVAGVPARIKGPIPDAVLARLRESSDGYVRLARGHAAVRGAG